MRFHSTPEQLARNEVSIVASGGWCAPTETLYDLGNITHVALWSANSPPQDDDDDFYEEEGVYE